MNRGSLAGWVIASLGLHVLLVWHGPEGGVRREPERLPLAVQLAPTAPKKDAAAGSPPPRPTPPPARAPKMEPPKPASPPPPQPDSFAATIPPPETAPLKTEPVSAESAPLQEPPSRKDEESVPAGRAVDEPFLFAVAEEFDAGPPPAPAMTRAEPAYAQNPPIPYPERARKRGWEGTVWLRVRVSAAGTVADIQLECSSGHEILDKAALRAVRHWRFTPARRGDEAVEAEVIVPVDFRIQEEREKRI